MRFLSKLRKAFLASIYAVAMLVWVALVFDTASLAQRAATPFQLPTATAVAVAPTVPASAPPRPRATAQPDVAFQERPEAQEPQGAIHPKTGRYVSAWLPNSFGSENRASFEANADILDEVSPFWYQTDIHGSLLAGGDARDASLVQLAHDNDVLVIPSIHNVVLVDPVPTMLRNPEARARHIRLIVDEVLTHNYDGIDIDYEMLDASLRDEYSAFMIDLGAALHAQNKMLTVAVHAKTCDFCGLGGFQDWTMLNGVVDRLRIMTYDYSWRGGGPGPVAPVYWVTEVVEYARTVVDPAKIIVGVPFYGYDWLATGGDGHAYTWADVNSIIQAYGVEKTLVENDASGRVVQENRITYSTRAGRRIAYFATSRSLDAKLALVQDLDLAGIAIWRLGGEDPENWNVIRRRLVQDPFESQRMVNSALPEH